MQPQRPLVVAALVGKTLGDSVHDANFVVRIRHLVLIHVRAALDDVRPGYDIFLQLSDSSLTAIRTVAQ